MLIVKRGFALPTALFMVLVLFALATISVFQARENLRFTRLEAERTRLFFLAKAQVNQAIDLMNSDATWETSYTEDNPYVSTTPEGLVTRAWVEPDPEHPLVVHVHGEAYYNGRQLSQHYARAVTKGPPVKPLFFVQAGTPGLPIVLLGSPDVNESWTSLPPLARNIFLYDPEAVGPMGGDPEPYLPPDPSPTVDPVTGDPTIYHLAPMDSYTADNLGNLFAAYTTVDAAAKEWPTLYRYATGGSGWETLGPVPSYPGPDGKKRPYTDVRLAWMPGQETSDPGSLLMTARRDDGDLVLLRKPLDPDDTGGWSVKKGPDVAGTPRLVAYRDPKVTDPAQGERLCLVLPDRLMVGDGLDWSQPDQVGAWNGMPLPLDSWFRVVDSPQGGQRLQCEPVPDENGVVTYPRDRPPVDAVFSGTNGKLYALRLRPEADIPDSTYEFTGFTRQIDPADQPRAGEWQLTLPQSAMSWGVDPQGVPVLSTSGFGDTVSIGVPSSGQPVFQVENASGESVLTGTYAQKKFVMRPLKGGYYRKDGSVIADPITYGNPSIVASGGVAQPGANSVYTPAGSF